MSIRVILPLLIGLGLFISCTKEEVKTENKENPVANLTDKYFILQDAVSNPAYPINSTSSSTDMYHDYYKEPCILDDLRMYKSNGDLLYDNGATKCDPPEAQFVVLKWSLIENNTKIRTVQGAFSDTLTILVNDGTSLKYEKKKWKNGAVYIFTETWRVQ